MKTAQEILTSTNKFHINLGLKRIKLILAILDNPQRKYKIIHIAGTNGKGSTSKIINDILIEQFKNEEKKVGLYTSPHLFSYNERIKINNENISKYVFNRLINDINNLAIENNLDLTEFELLTTVAFYYFYIKKVDYVILETGLGGTYDATNVIDKTLIDIITTIDYDHTEHLGNTINKIALQKAGIIKENSKVIISKENLGYETVKKVADTKNAKIIEPIKTKVKFENGTNWAIIENKKIKFNLLGSHQAQNLSLALTAIKNLDIKIDEKSIENALEKISWKFRLDYDKQNNILIDGAHNPSGIKTLADFLKENFSNQTKTFIFGCLKNKNYKTMLNMLFDIKKQTDKIYFYEFKYKNALKFDELDDDFKKQITKINSLEEIRNIIKNDKNLKIVCGSIYMLGEIFNDQAN